MKCFSSFFLWDIKFCFFPHTQIEYYVRTYLALCILVNLVFKIGLVHVDFGGVEFPFFA